MVKNIIFLFSILIMLPSCAQSNLAQGSSINVTKQKVFAKEKNGIFLITVDTIQLKRKMKDNLFSTTEVSFDKIEVVKQYTLGEKSTEFYYMMAHDFKNNILVAKWLTKIGETFYENNVIEEGDLFEQSYLICKGDKNCTPQVFIMDSLRLWGCSDDPSCITDKKKAKEMEAQCKVYKSVFLE